MVIVAKFQCYLKSESDLSHCPCSDLLHIEHQNTFCWTFLNFWECQQENCPTLLPGPLSPLYLDMFYLSDLFHYIELLGVWASKQHHVIILAPQHRASDENPRAFSPWDELFSLVPGLWPLVSTNYNSLLLSSCRLMKYINFDIYAGL